MPDPEQDTITPEQDAVAGSSIPTAQLPDEVAQAAQGEPTVAQILRQGYERARHARPPKDILIPGYGEPESELHALFRAVDDYEEVRDSIRGTVERRGVTDAQREVEIGIEMLHLASVGSYALIAGQRHDIGLPLGGELYDYLFPDDGSARPGNDRQAIVLLFHGRTLPLMTAYAELDRWWRQAGVDAEEQQVGESSPAGAPPAGPSSSPSSLTAPATSTTPAG